MPLHSHSNTLISKVKFAVSLPQIKRGESGRQTDGQRGTARGGRNFDYLGADNASCGWVAVVGGFSTPRPHQWHERVAQRLTATPRSDTFNTHICTAAPEMALAVRLIFIFLRFPALQLRSNRQFSDVCLGIGCKPCALVYITIQVTWLTARATQQLGQLTLPAPRLRQREKNTQTKKV